MTRHSSGTFSALLRLSRELGRTPDAVLAAMLMAEKAAEIWTGAAAVGGPKFLSPEIVHRIAHRADEHYRQRALNL